MPHSGNRPAPHNILALLALNFRRGSRFEQNGAVTEFAQTITGISERAVVHRETSAADTSVELISKLGEATNPIGQHIPPDRGQMFPIGRCQYSPGGKLVQRGFDGRQGDTRALCDFDDGDTTQDIPCIASLIALVSRSLNQSFRLVEMDGCDRHASAAGNFSDRKRNPTSIAIFGKTLDLIYT